MNAVILGLTNEPPSEPVRDGHPYEDGQAGLFGDANDGGEVRLGRELGDPRTGTGSTRATFLIGGLPWPFPRLPFP
jgi:hypothetical protein